MKKNKTKVKLKKNIWKPIKIKESNAVILIKKGIGINYHYKIDDKEILIKTAELKISGKTWDKINIKSDQDVDITIITYKETLIERFLNAR